MHVRVLAGAGVLDELGHALDEMHAAVRAPLMTRRPWLNAWLASYPRYRPLAITVEAGGELAAAALLAEEDSAVTRIVAAGHGPSDAAALPARDGEAAEALATAIADHLSRHRRPWQLKVRHLPAGDAVAAALARKVRRASVAAGAVSPVLRVGESRALRAYVTRNHHQQARRLHNRLRRDGLDPMIAHLRDPDDVLAVLPEVVEVCRTRDLALDRRSAMDNPAARAFFHRVVDEHARRNSVVLTMLRVDGQLAAYVLCFIDGTAFRMWNCRFLPTWSRYGVGRLAHDAALEHALASGCEFYDWGRGEEAYKSSASNDRVRTEDLYAWSGPFVAAQGRMLLGVKAIAERAEKRGGVAGRAACSARGLFDRMRGQ